MKCWECDLSFDSYELEECRACEETLCGECMKEHGPQCSARIVDEHGRYDDDHLDDYDGDEDEGDGPVEPLR